MSRSIGLTIYPVIPIISQNLTRIREACASHGVKQLSLIGSAAADTFKPGQSDIDFLVDFSHTERGGFDDPYFKLLEELQDILQQPIDLVERATLRNPYLIASINRSEQPFYVYAA